MLRTKRRKIRLGPIRPENHASPSQELWFSDSGWGVGVSFPEEMLPSGAKAQAAARSWRVDLTGAITGPWVTVPRLTAQFGETVEL